mmetsp:Transcript_5406/g.9055  ORF Transcript_5406/g.9055 Transcript_5406/m.9055 type:complete len:214 (+) Transcript_5406:362-1003(+)
MHADSIPSTHHFGPRAHHRAVQIRGHLLCRLLLARRHLHLLLLPASVVQEARLCVSPLLLWHLYVLHIADAPHSHLHLSAQLPHRMVDGHAECQDLCSHLVAQNALFCGWMGRHFYVSVYSHRLEWLHDFDLVQQRVSAKLFLPAGSFGAGWRRDLCGAAVCLLLCHCDHGEAATDVRLENCDQESRKRLLIHVSVCCLLFILYTFSSCIHIY